MATLVLTTLGSALGGPIGGALGSIIGQSIDRNLFGPPVRRGPRLDDLRVQASSYGVSIPRIYGRMRVAGTVVWASDLREEEVVTGGGKGAPGAITYAYSASFAVALSSRPAQSIGRIWADGKLLRGADGKFKSKVTHRFHPGGEAQSVDPLIASVEGPGGSPAFRGLALAVFEEMALADFGNRIPSLTFELIADGAPPRVAAVISDISRGLIEEAGEAATLVGFAALGNDQRSALEPLVDLWGAVYHDDGGLLRSIDSAAPVTIGAPQGAGCSVEGDRPAPRVEREQEAADALPAVLTLDYHDPQRDFQAGQMRASVAGGGQSRRRLDSASALEADAAKSLASNALARRWAGRDRVTLRLAPAYLGLRPGQYVRVVDVAGLYRIESVTIDALVVVVAARRVHHGTSALAADPGRGNLDPDLSSGQSFPVLVHLPWMGAMGAGGLGVALALGCGGRFRSTVVAVEANGQPLASLRVDLPAITGVATTVLAKGSSRMVDRINSVSVALSNPASLLYHADADALAMGANAMLIGSELVQFGRAVPTGAGTYLLSELLRGCRGTEWAEAVHAVGEPIVLIEPARLTRVEMDPAMIGAEVVARAYGPADDAADPPRFALAANGEGLRPPSPCHLAIRTGPDNYVVSWVERRWTAGWSASSGDEAGAASFVLTVRRGSGTLVRTASERSLVIAAADIAALGTGPIQFELIENGNVASRPALLTLNA